MPGFELIDEKERKAVNKIFDNGSVFFRHGFDNLRNGIYEVENFEKEFSSYLGRKYSIGVSSCTAALRVALASIGIKTGDEVITQSFTFVATFEAIIESGATPIVVEIDENLDLDIKDLEKKITSRTKCIIPVHMLGSPSNMPKIMEIASSKNLYVIEDTAWGLGGSINNKKLGAWGHIGAFSFDYAKAMTTGEGGMLSFDEEKLYRKAKAWHDHGHENNPNLPRWKDSRSSGGFNYRMNEIQGAIGRVQLKKLDKIINMQISEKIKLSKITNKYGLKTRESNKNYNETADSFIFFMQNMDEALSMKKYLNYKKIDTKILPEAISWHFAGYFNHLQILNNKYNNKLKDCLSKSYYNLSKAISLPIMKNNNNLVEKLDDALFNYFNIAKK